MERNKEIAVDPMMKERALREDRWFNSYWSIRAWLLQAERLSTPGTDLVDAIFNGPRAFEEAIRLSARANKQLRPEFSYPTEFIDEGRRLSVEAHEALSAKMPKENAYQAAICIISNWGWNGNHLNNTLLFRGEADVRWSKTEFLTTIQRHGDKDFNELRRKIDVSAHWFRKQFPERADSDIELLAILQHYGQPTWLLDLSTSPLVSLFFASANSSKPPAPEIGVVYKFSRAELERCHRIGPELVGELRYIKPHFVPRIDRQYGVFIDGGAGWATRNLVQSELSFRHQPHFQFEDSGLGVTKHHLLSNNDEWKWFDNELSSRFASSKAKTTEMNLEPFPLMTPKTEDCANDFQSARVLGLPARLPPGWPPSVRILETIAGRMIQSRTSLDSRRIELAAQAIAALHNLVCKKVEPTQRLDSLYIFFDVVQQYSMQSDDVVFVEQLLDSYTSSFVFQNHLNLLHMAFSEFRTQFTTKQI